MPLLFYVNGVEVVESLLFFFICRACFRHKLQDEFSRVYSHYGTVLTRIYNFIGSKRLDRLDRRLYSLTFEEEVALNFIHRKSITLIDGTLSNDNFIYQIMIVVGFVKSRKYRELITRNAFLNIEHVTVFVWIHLLIRFFLSAISIIYILFFLEAAFDENAWRFVYLCIKISLFYCITKCRTLHKLH